MGDAGRAPGIEVRGKLRDVGDVGPQKTLLIGDGQIAPLSFDPGHSRESAIGDGGGGGSGVEAQGVLTTFWRRSGDRIAVGRALEPVNP